MKTYLYLFAVLFLLFACVNGSDSNNGSEDENEQPIEGETDEELSFLTLPENYAIQIYADNVDNARQLALSENGTLFVGSRRDKVHAVRDTDGDGRADETIVIAQGLKQPNGVALKNGDLYIAEISRILKIPNVDENLSKNMEFEVIYDDYPTEEHHGWKFISFGPDGKLYVPVGAPCNICDPDEIFATITRMNDDGSNMEILHSGIRNTVGFNWHPGNQKLWFTDNGRDRLGDDMPGDELNYADSENLHYGYPYCHQGDFLDPELGEGKNCDDYVAPAQVLNPHVAALGIEFWNTENFPAATENKVFIAEHGSWNSTIPVGYRITTVDVTSDGQASNYVAFIDGFRDNEANELYGRPVDLEWMPDGSLLISDDHANRVYRLFYKQ